MEKMGHRYRNGMQIIAELIYYHQIITNVRVKGEEFLDDCDELELLRNFRDSYVKENYPQDIEKYYVIAPKIVEKVKGLKDNVDVFRKMYYELVLPCCNLIEENKLYEAYNRYKNYSLELAEKYLQ